jgi:3-phosphoshikimate 1-carboxyvinyltransferase
MAALANGVSEIYNSGNSDDSRAAVEVCRALGASIAEFPGKLVVTGGMRQPSQTLNCGESGLGIRMFSAIASTFSADVTLTGTGTLLNRPMQPIADALVQLGATCITSSGFLPITVKGPINGGVANIDGSQGSQVLTGLLVASPLAKHDVTIRAAQLKSVPYVRLTIQMMLDFCVEVDVKSDIDFHVRASQRYVPCSYNVEGDWSGAAFMLVAGATAGELKVKNLNPSSLQADRVIVDALVMAGATVDVEENSVYVKRNKLSHFEFDATNCPDLFPPLVALASHCDGESKILGVNRLRVKESDRAATLMEEFGKLGIDIKINGDVMVVQGGKVKSAWVHSHGDHRIAMACAVAALSGEGNLTIEGAEAVSKSYPRFFDDLNNLVNNSSLNV